MLTRLLHYLVARPWIYDRVQALAGAATVDRHLAAALQPLLRPGLSVVDVGGGTGLARPLFPSDCRYVCLDTDETKLASFSKKYPDGIALLSDATRMPIDSHGVDLVLCRFVAHHVAEEQLPALFHEIRRILKPAGSLVFVDAVWRKERRISRLIWRYDRGSYPRREERLVAALQANFVIQCWERFTVFHEYVLGIGKPNGKAGQQSLASSAAADDLREPAPRG